jgi:hypothetical protein
MKYIQKEEFEIKDYGSVEYIKKNSYKINNKKIEDNKKIIAEANF